jgi:hypothetical protein
VASLCRAGLDTRRDAQKVSEITISYVISSPLSRLAWRNIKYLDHSKAKETAHLRRWGFAVLAYLLLCRRLSAAVTGHFRSPSAPTSRAPTTSVLWKPIDFGDASTIDLRDYAHPAKVNIRN